MFGKMVNLKENWLKMFEIRKNHIKISQKSIVLDVFESELFHKLDDLLLFSVDLIFKFCDDSQGGVLVVERDGKFLFDFL